MHSRIRDEDQPVQLSALSGDLVLRSTVETAIPGPILLPLVHKCKNCSRQPIQIIVLSGCIHRRWWSVMYMNKESSQRRGPYCCMFARVGSSGIGPCCQASAYKTSACYSYFGDVRTCQWRRHVPEKKLYYIYLLPVETPMARAAEMVGHKCIVLEHIRNF